MKPNIHTIQNAVRKASVETILARGLFILGCLLAVGVATAQSKEPTTVYIKKTETINGVKKVTDTTYTVGDVSSIILNDGMIDVITTYNNGESFSGEDLSKQIDIEVKNALKEAGIDEATVKGESLSKQIDLEVKNALKKAGIDETTVKGDRLIILNDNDATTSISTGEGSKQVIVTKTLIKRIDIKDADKKELKRLGQSTGDKEQKLNLTNMNFYPNPNTGKFNLSFSLPEKGDADITIMNTEGKVVYTEKLPAFSGSYDKEIDISKQAKGIYFVKVEQGKNSQVKKIVLE